MTRLIAIEGLDGSGKGTQLELLARDLRAAGARVATAAFPSYDSGLIGQKVGEYLDGQLGRVPDDRPWLPALLFAADRYEHGDELRRALATSDFLLVDRYVASNIAFQAARLDRPQLIDFAAWLEQLEFGVFGLPRPSLQLYLRMPAATARRLVLRKKRRSYTDRDLDLYEVDSDRQTRSARIYEWLAQSRFASAWRVVDAADATGEPRTREAITAELRLVVEGVASGSPVPDAPAE